MVYLTRDVGLALFCIVGTASAHHSAAPHFDLNSRIEVQGVVTKLALVNPHAYVYLNVIEDDELVEWRCELRAGTILERAAWDESTLPVGASIGITGFPARREENVCKSDLISLNGGPTVEVMSVGETYGSSGDRAEPAGRRSATVTSDFPEYLANGQPNISGYWVAAGRNPNGRAQWPQTKAGLEASRSWDYRFDFAELRCEGSNIIETLYHDRHVNEFAQFDDRIVLQYGFMDVRRVIYINQFRHPDTIQPTMVGYSNGHWDEKTLVVDTIGFAQGALIPPRGILHSEQMHVVERFTVNNDGDIEWKFTATDPFIETPFTGGLTLTRTERPYRPYGCVELSGSNNIRPPE